jgi:hypothetical protein
MHPATREIPKIMPLAQNSATSKKFVVPCQFISTTGKLIFLGWVTQQQRYFHQIIRYNLKDPLPPKEPNKLQQRNTTNGFFVRITPCLLILQGREKE